MPETAPRYVRSEYNPEGFLKFLAVMVGLSIAAAIVGGLAGVVLAQQAHSSLSESPIVAERAWALAIRSVLGGFGSAIAFSVCRSALLLLTDIRDTVMFTHNLHGEQAPAAKAQVTSPARQYAVGPDGQVVTRGP